MSSAVSSKKDVAPGPRVGPLRRLARWTGAGVALALAGVVGLQVVGHLFPLPCAQLAYGATTTLLLDRTGRPIRVMLGPDDLDQRPTYRVRAGDWIAPAMIAAEDRRFRTHGGVDLLALARAVGQNLCARRTVSGASTISTQVIRLLEPRPRTLWTKLIEAVGACRLEAASTKDEILTQYLNRAPFGGNMVGIEAASRRYFGVPAASLNLGQAALLAGVPQSPARLRPDRHPDRARARQAYVLQRMVACGFITEAQLQDALAQPLQVRAPAYPFVAPHFAEAAVARLGAGRDGEVRTSLDAGLQAMAEAAVRRGVAALPGVGGGAVVVIEVRTGAVRAMVGSPDPGNVRAAGRGSAALAARTPGSALKPFAYAMAFDEGWLAPATVLPDAPRAFSDFAPKNFDGECGGMASARDALVRSLNLPALEVVDRLGAARFHARLKALGFAGLDGGPSSYGLGLVLGNAEVTLLDLANAYAALARGGVYRPPQFIEGASPSPEVRRPRIFSEEACWMIADILSGDERVGQTTGHRADARLVKLAWKTGTSSGFRDAWVVAYNPEFVVGVWIGNPDGASSPSLVGGEAATPVAWEMFRQIYPDAAAPWFVRPAGVTERRVCAISGEPPGPGCGTCIDDWCIPGVSLQRPCGVHGITADGGPAAEHWPAHVAAFLKARAIRATEAAADTGPRICQPRAGATYRRIPGLEHGEASIALEALGTGRLHWFAEGVYLGQSGPGRPLLWSAPRGRASIVCADEHGRCDRVCVTVQ